MKRLTLYKFTAGEASPAIYYGRGTWQDAARYIARLRRDTGFQFSGTPVLGEDAPRVDREENVRWLANDERIEREHKQAMAGRS